MIDTFSWSFNLISWLKPSLALHLFSPHKNSITRCAFIQNLPTRHDELLCFDCNRIWIIYSLSETQARINFVYSFSSNSSCDRLLENIFATSLCKVIQVRSWVKWRKRAAIIQSASAKRFLLPLFANWFQILIFQKSNRII